MGRPRRAADGGVICHVLNRGDARMPIFEKDGDYEAFERILEEGVERYDTGLLAWCLMPNHWHQVVKSHSDGEVVSRPGRGALSRVCCYVERNALRANLVKRAEDWRWHRGSTAQKQLLAPWPVRRSPGWLEHVNTPQTEAELSAVRRSVVRGCPCGDEWWSKRMVKRLGRESTLPPHSRPKKNQNGS
jgi:putative transposase